MLDPKKAAAALKKRRDIDPCYVYEPGPTQLDFHKSDAYYRLVSGGNRSGKTSSCLIELAQLVRQIHPYKKPYGPVIALVFCISRQQATMVVQKKLFESCEFPGEIGKQPMIPKR